MEFRELRDGEWGIISAFLPPKPKRIYGDSAYDTGEIRAKLERDGVEANMPVNPRNGRRQIPYDEEGYKMMMSAI